MNRLRKFSRLERRDRLLFCESFMFHLFVGLLLKIVPFRWIPGLFSSRQFGTPAQAQSRTRSVGAEDQSRYAVSGWQALMIEKIRLAVQRAGWVSPWKNRCLVSSLAGRWMLRRRKIESELSLGVAKDAKGRLLAHAWLKSGDLEIVEKRGEFTEVYHF